MILLRGRLKDSEREKDYIILCIHPLLAFVLFTTLYLLTLFVVMQGKKIVDGKPGDRFKVAEGFQGKWENAVGVPVSSSAKGNAVPIPPGGNGAANVVEVARPDFRAVDKKDRVFKK